MHYSILNNFKRAMIVLLIVGAFGFYTASILSMHHEDGMMVNCPIGMTQGTAEQDSTACLSYHLGLMHNLSETSSQNLSTQFLALFLVVLVGFSVLSLKSFIESFYSRLRVRYRRLFEKSSQVFFVQLGFWLTLFEKRDPSFAFAQA